MKQKKKQQFSSISAFPFFLNQTLVIYPLTSTNKSNYFKTDIQLNQRNPIIEIKPSYFERSKI